MIPGQRRLLHVHWQIPCFDSFANVDALVEAFRWEIVLNEFKSTLSGNVFFSFKRLGTFMEGIWSPRVLVFPSICNHGVNACYMYIYIYHNSTTVLDVFLLHVNVLSMTLVVSWPSLVHLTFLSFAWKQILTPEIHFLAVPFISVHVPSCPFMFQKNEFWLLKFIFLAFPVIFLHFLSFLFMFLHVLSFFKKMNLTPENHFCITCTFFSFIHIGRAVQTNAHVMYYRIFFLTFLSFSLVRLAFLKKRDPQRLEAEHAGFFTASTETKKCGQLSWTAPQKNLKALWGSWICATARAL